MVKGVNRQVLEIQETQSPYFERALLFVRPEYAHIDQKKLQAAAQAAVGATDRVPKPKAGRVKRLYYWLAGGVLSAVGVGASVLLCLLR